MILFIGLKNGIGKPYIYIIIERFSVYLRPTETVNTGSLKRLETRNMVDFTFMEPSFRKS